MKPSYAELMTGGEFGTRLICKKPPTEDEEKKIQQKVGVLIVGTKKLKTTSKIVENVNFKPREQS